MNGKPVPLFFRARAAIPLALFLLFLNTALAVKGSLDFKVLLCGVSLWALAQLIYVYDSLFRTGEDVANIPGEAAGRSRSWPVFAAAAAPAACLVWAGFWPLVALGLAVIPLYSDPDLLPRRLKEIPVLKNLLNVLDLWLAGVLVPVLFVHDLSGPLVLQLLRSTAPLILLLFSLTVLLDVRDAHGDGAAGVRTIPVLAGSAVTAAGCAALCAAAAALFWTRGIPRGAAAAALMAVFSLGALKPRGRAYYDWLLVGVDLALAVPLAARLQLGVI